jgi:hypothetical protein
MAESPPRMYNPERVEEKETVGIFINIPFTLASE